MEEEIKYGKGRLIRDIRFVGEQDGDPERALKKELTRLLGSYPKVHSAFLARTLFDGEETVALCLYTGEPFSHQLAEEVGNVFHRMFRPEMHLDVLFLGPGQVKEIIGVCRPFFEGQF